MLRIVVQERRRFLREAIASVLARASDVCVVATVTAAELIEACQAHHPDVVVIDLDDPAVSIDELGALAPQSGRPRSVVGLHARHRDDFEVVDDFVVRGVPDEDGVGGIVRACRLDARRVEAPAVLLSEREAQILRLIAAGGRSAEIGAELGISSRTVEEHKRRIFDKLAVTNQAQAVVRAIQLGHLGTVGGRG